MVVIELLQAGLKNYPHIIWYLLFMLGVTRVCLYEVIAPEYLHDLLYNFQTSSREATFVNLLFLSKGTLCLIFALIATIYLSKVIILLTSVLLVTTITIPLHIIKIMQSNEVKDIFSPIEKLSRITTFWFVFGEPSIYVLFCELFRISEQGKQFYLFQFSHVWLENVAVIIGTVLIRIILNAETVVIHGWTRYSTYLFGCGLVFGLALAIFLLCNLSRFRTRGPAKKRLLGVLRYMWYLIEIKCGEHPDRYSAERHFGLNIIEDTNEELDLLVMLFALIPLIVLKRDRSSFNFLYQFSKLDLHIFFFTIYPHEGRAIIAIFNLILLPIAHFKIFPMTFKRLSLNTPLKFIGIGYLLLGLAFCWSGAIQIILDRRTTSLKSSGTSQLRLYNTLPYTITVKSLLTGQTTIKAYHMEPFLTIRTNKKNLYTVFTVKDEHNHEWHSTLKLVDAEAVTALVIDGNIRQIEGFDPLLPRLINRPKMLFYCATDNCGNGTIKLTTKDYRVIFEKRIPRTNKRTEIHLKDVGSYYLFIGGSQMGYEEELLNGGIYSVLIYKINGSLFGKHYIILEPNHVDFLWTIPQYILMSMSDVTSKVALNIFIYTQSPAALRMLNIGFLHFIMTLGDIAMFSLSSVHLVSTRAVFMECIFIFIFLIFYLISAMKFKYKRIGKIYSDDIVSTI